jgi:hypothetical protein
MNYVSKLTDVLSGDLSGWHKARLKFMARFIGSLLQLATVNFTELALTLKPSVKADSSYRRIQRFMAGFAFDFDAFGYLLLRLLPQKGGFVVSMDRTNWQFGEIQINVLMIGICRNGTCFPVVWRLLGKAGNSNTEERIALTRRFLALVEAEDIRAFVADREFIGESWLGFLNGEGVPFHIRIRKNTNVGAERVAAHKLFSDLKVGQQRILKGGKHKVLGHDLHVVGMKYIGREGEPEHLLLVCPERPEEALSCYRRRWGIETLFAALKSRGFDLEATHLTDEKRLEKLLGLLALAFAWSELVGEWRNRRDPLQTKKHGRLQKSRFRYGLDYLRQIMLNLTQRQEDFLVCLQALVAPRKFLSRT